MNSFYKRTFTIYVKVYMNWKIFLRFFAAHYMVITNWQKKFDENKRKIVFFAAKVTQIDQIDVPGDW